MPTQSRGHGRRSTSTRRRLGWKAASPIGANTNQSLTTAGRSTATQGHSPNGGQSSRSRGIVRRRSTSPQIKQIWRQQTSADARTSKRRPRVMIKGIQFYIGRTCLNFRILQHPLMALRLVLPLKTIVDQILRE
jgi:hypothetical protein